MILLVTLRRKLAYSGNPDDEVEGNGCAFQILLTMRAYGMRSRRHVFGLKLDRIKRRMITPENIDPSSMSYMDHCRKRI